MQHTRKMCLAVGSLLGLAVPAACAGGHLAAGRILTAAHGGAGPLLLSAAGEPLARPFNFSTWLREPIGAGASPQQWLLVAALLVVVLVIQAVLRRLYRRATESAATASPPPAEGAAEHIPWLKLTLEAAIPPVRLLLWVWVGYVVLALGLAEVSLGEARDWLYAALAWLRDLGTIGAIFWLLFRAIKVVEARLKRWAARTQNKWDDVLSTLVVRALRLVIPLVGVIAVAPLLNVPAGAHAFFRLAGTVLLILAVGIILYQLVCALEEAVLRQFRIDVKDNLEARKIYTQVKVLKKLAVVVILVFTIASMLMVFEPVRRLGTSILASAGVLGIIIGFAAQKSIATIVAGFQIAMTQPIRLDDVVIVENEWGWIEEITLTYVVVRIWDLRRLIVPINYFIERPFQNWTRVSAEILGTVFIYMDYTVPLKAVRDELTRILKKSKNWDQKVNGVQVTNATDRTVEVRALMSAEDSGKAWDLRCEVREKLLEFLQRKYPNSLPRLRAELEPPPAWRSPKAKK